MEHSLSGKNIVIIGASSEIGKLTALALASEGANLVLAARRELELEDLALQCEKLGVQAYFYKTDVTVLDQVNNLFEFALDKLGSIDIWIHNASIAAVGEFIKTPMTSHEQVIKTNLLGFMHSSYISLPYFKDQGRGILLNNTSLGAFVPTPFASAYAASSVGVKGFIQAIRTEMVDQKNIHICEVLPSHLAYNAQKVTDAVITLCKHPKEKLMVESSDRIARVIQAVTPTILGLVVSKVFQKADGWRYLHPLRLIFRH